MTLATILDLVALVLLVVFAIYGIAKGFANTGFNLLLWLVAIFISWKLAPALATLLGKWGMTESIGGWVSTKLNTPAITLAAETGTLDALKAPKFVLNWIAKHNNAESFAAYGVSNIGDFVKAYATSYIIRAIAFLIIFAICAIIIAIIMGLVHKTQKKLKSRALDRLLGLVAGIFLGAVIIMLIALAFYYLNLAGEGTKLGDAIEASKLFKFFYNHNLFVKIFGL